jgi:hypothetical protein
MTPLEFSREHEVITRMFLALARGVCRKYFPGQPLHHQIELVLWRKCHCGGSASGSPQGYLL